MADDLKVPENKVPGCLSVVHAGCLALRCSEIQSVDYVAASLSQIAWIFPRCTLLWKKMAL